ncbi:MAG: hypothetical protein WA160_00550 [Pseudobdellovibrio sp.]
MKTLFVVYIALVVLAVSSCQKSSQSDATAPGMNGQCVNNPSLCQANTYNTPGFSQYNYNNQNGDYYNNGYGYNNNYGGGYINPFQNLNNSQYLCNCGPGSIPTYNGFAGLGCAETSQSYGYGYAYFGWGANNNQWVNIPQISNYQGYSQQSCYNGVVQSCFTDQPTTCSAGFSCRANSASTRLGLCVSGTGVPTNNFNNSGGYYNTQPR